jgi:hypothetical protein
LPDYTNEQEIKAIVQVGLSSDIAPISNFMVKLALLELSKGLKRSSLSKSINMRVSNTGFAGHIKQITDLLNTSKF